MGRDRLPIAVISEQHGLFTGRSELAQRSRRLPIGHGHAEAIQRHDASGVVGEQLAERSALQISEAGQRICDSRDECL